MATPIIMPKFGQMTEESAIVEWHKREGDKIAKGDVLFTIETDKSLMDVESFEEGTLLKILIKPGVSVAVQSTVGFLGQPGEAIPDAAASTATPTLRPTTAASCSTPVGAHPENQPEMPAVAATVPTPVAASGSAHLKISPRAAALVRDFAIDPSRITGSGPDGRIIEKDIRAYLDARGHAKPGTLPASEALAAREKPRPMSRMRQVIAQRLTQSFRDTPHFYVTVTVDMTGLITFRDQLKAAGTPCTVTDFIAKAVILALQEFPDLNSSTDGAYMRRRDHVNLGIAVSLDEGLVVPVIPAAEQLSFWELIQRSREVVEKARTGKATPDELSGGTFTISNMGMMDVENFSAIINPGESAILAVASAQPQPVVRDGRIVVRHMMKVTLSCDHRVVDGALGARFVNAVKQKIENLELWKRLTT